MNQTVHVCYRSTLSTLLPLSGIPSLGLELSWCRVNPAPEGHGDDGGSASAAALLHRFSSPALPHVLRQRQPLVLKFRKLTLKGKRERVSIAVSCFVRPLTTLGI